MATCNMVCRVKIKKWMWPLLYLASVAGWEWLSRKCVDIKVEAVSNE